MARGRVHKFGEDMNTDYIISAKNKENSLNINDMVQFLMEDIHPGFSKEVSPGDFIVAGKNFGCGSSREAAPAVIKAAGIAGVISPLFARIFYRNAINVGLPLLEFESDVIENGEEIEVDFQEGKITQLSTGSVHYTNPVPQFMMSILKEGGLVPFLKKNHGFGTNNF